MTIDMQNAISALDSFRSELMREDDESAKPIRGLELFDHSELDAALHTIRTMTVPDSCENVRWLTVRTLNRLVLQHQESQLVA